MKLLSGNILSFLILSLFLMFPLVSSLDTNELNEMNVTFNGIPVEDNVILEEYKPLEIVSLFGLGDVLFEGYIYEHDNTCGEECFSYINVSLSNSGSLIDDIIFKTLQSDGSWVEQDVRSYEIKYFALVNETECVFGELPRCYFTNETKMDWVRYSLGQSVDAGVYEIKIEAKKRPDRTIDWVIKTNDKWLESWATWGNISNGVDAEVLLLSPANNSVGTNFTFECFANVTGGSWLKNISFWNDIGGVFSEREAVIFGEVLETTDWTLVGQNDWEGTFYSIPNWTYSEIGGGGSRAGGWVNLSSGDFYGVDLSDTRSEGYLAYLYYSNGYTNGQQIFTHNISETDLSISMRYTDWHYFSGMSGWIEWLNSSGDVIKSEQFVNEPAQQQPLDDWQIVKSDWIENATQVRIRTTAYNLGYGTGLVIDYIDIGEVVYNSTQTFNATIDDTTIWNCQACDSDDECGFGMSNYILQPDVVIIPETPEDNSVELYGIMESSGAGLGMFLLYMANSLPTLSLVFLVALIISSIGYVISQIIIKFKIKL